MTKNALMKYTKKDYDSYLNQKSILELIDIMNCLEENKPYIKLSHNGEVGDFLKEKYSDIPISNVKEFDTFYESLNNKIAELADTDKRAKIFLEQANYQRELNELPKLMNKLEKFSLDAIKPKFEAVLEYVYDAVMNQGFGMEVKNKIDIYEIESTYIKPKVGKVSIEINNKSTDLSICKKKRELGIQIECLGGQELKLKNYCPVLDIESATKVIEYFIWDNKKTEVLIKDLKTIFSLPSIMNDYLKGKIKKLENCVEELK